MHVQHPFSNLLCRTLLQRLHEAACQRDANAQLRLGALSGQGLSLSDISHV
jgi:hypothetical protein